MPLTDNWPTECHRLRGEYDYRRGNPYGHSKHFDHGAGYSVNASESDLYAYWEGWARARAWMESAHALKAESRRTGRKIAELGGREWKQHWRRR